VYPTPRAAELADTEEARRVLRGDHDSSRRIDDHRQLQTQV